MTDHTAGRELQARAAAVLARLLAEDLPEAYWTLRRAGIFARDYAGDPAQAHLLRCQLQSMGDLAAWCARWGLTPTPTEPDKGVWRAVLVLDGIGVDLYTRPAEHQGHS